MLVHEITVAAPVAEVWYAWTTEEGLRFISAKSRVELRPGGAYEWFLDLPPDAAGRRGSEGSRVLAWLPSKMLAFAWTFPPDVPTLRAAGATTQVVVMFDALEGGGSRVRLHAHGWRDGADWEAGRRYFDAAWSAVLAQLQRHFDDPQGPPRG